MKRLASLVCGGLLLGSSAIAGVVPVAAQPGGPCALVSDDSLTTALGSPVHALGVLSGGAAATSAVPMVADMCYAQLGAGNVVMITHMVGVQTPGDVGGTLSMTQGAPGGLGGMPVDPSILSVTQMSGLGDAAVMLSGNPAGQSYANLIVWRGTESFSITGTGLTDAQTSLSALAQTLLANSAAQP